MLLTITVEVDERSYRALHLKAAREGADPRELAGKLLEREVSLTREYDDVLPPGSPYRDTRPGEHGRAVGRTQGR